MFLAVVGGETVGKAELFLLAVQVIHQGCHCEVGLMEARVSHPKVALVSSGCGNQKAGRPCFQMEIIIIIIDLEPAR